MSKKKSCFEIPMFYIIYICIFHIGMLCLFHTWRLLWLWYRGSYLSRWYQFESVSNCLSSNSLTLRSVPSTLAITLFHYINQSNVMIKVTNNDTQVRDSLMDWACETKIYDVEKFVFWFCLFFSEILVTINQSRN